MDAFDEIARNLQAEQDLDNRSELERIIDDARWVNNDLRHEAFDTEHLRVVIDDLNERWAGWHAGHQEVRIRGTVYFGGELIDNHFARYGDLSETNFTDYPCLGLGFYAIDEPGEQAVVFAGTVLIEEEDGEETNQLAFMEPECIVTDDERFQFEGADNELNRAYAEHFNAVGRVLAEASDECQTVQRLRPYEQLPAGRPDEQSEYVDILRQTLDESAKFDAAIPYTVTVAGTISMFDRQAKEHVPVIVDQPLAFVLAYPQLSVDVEMGSESIVLKGTKLGVEKGDELHVRLPLSAIQNIESCRKYFKFD